MLIFFFTYLTPACIHIIIRWNVGMNAMLLQCNSIRCWSLYVFPLLKGWWWRLYAQLYSTTTTTTSSQPIIEERRPLNNNITLTYFTFNLNQVVSKLSLVFWFVVCGVSSVLGIFLTISERTRINFIYPHTHTTHTLFFTFDIIVQILFKVAE